MKEKSEQLSRGPVAQLLLLLVLSIFTPSAYAADFETIIAPGGPEDPAGSIIFTLKNLTAAPMEILVWNTPLEGSFNNRAFSIFKDGKKVSYTGRLVKRGKPQESDYLLIGPGSSRSATIALPEGYDMHGLGVYEVTFTGHIRYRLLREGKSSGAVNKVKMQKKTSSNKLLLELSLQPEQQTLYKLPPVYSGCSTSRMEILNNALTEAERIAGESHAILNDTALADRDQAGRYESWFGTYTSTRYNQVVEHFAQTSAALSNQTIEFYCDCTDEYYAWVYPNQPYKIHLCNAFWEAPLTGTDSQSGAVIHEMSHFQAVAGTNDYVYGQDGAFSLALSTPSDAVDNADNHEYFAENSPYLPMERLLELKDTFATSLAVNSRKAYSMADNSAATEEPGEPSHAETSGGKSLWFSWQAKAPGTVRINTIGSWIDTLLAVYTGSAVSNLTQIVANDDIADTIYQSEVSFTASVGQTYHVAVDGYGGATGMVYVFFAAEIPGDVNGDMQVDLYDAVAAMKVLAGQEISIAAVSDIDQDDRVGIAELIYILQVITGSY